MLLGISPCCPTPNSLLIARYPSSPLPWYKLLFSPQSAASVVLDTATGSGQRKDFKSLLVRVHHIPTARCDYGADRDRAERKENGDQGCSRRFLGGLVIRLRVRHLGLPAFDYVDQACFKNIHAFIKLLVGHDQRDQDTHDVAERSCGNGDEAVFVSVVG